jgi:predicted GNAT superfamily acetyltransferase
LSIILSSVGEETAIAIRDIDDFSEMHEVEALQKDVWGIDDLDVVPLTMLVASREVGAVLVGAYDGPTLVGFVYGFPGYENRHFVHHSHMLAVKPAYRNLNLGFKLKLAQRERVLAQGIKRITWTFDPLQSLNAYFNFAKLGVVADSYKINFYGEATSSFLHQIGTDRLWATWLPDSQRVRERLQRTKKNGQGLGREGIPFLVAIDSNGAPQRNESSEALGEQHLLVAIPADINRLQKVQPQVAVKWREATRWAFASAITSGYLVEEFYYPGRKDHVGVYLLTYGKRLEDSA